MTDRVRNNATTWEDEPPLPFGWCNPCLVDLLKAEPGPNGSRKATVRPAVTLVATAQTCPIGTSGQVAIGVVALPTCAAHLGVRKGSSPLWTG